jgi:phosphatidate cytidylyltransferase
MLKQRTISYLIILPLIIVVVWIGKPWFTILAVIWGLGGAYEFFHIVKKSKNISPLTFFGLLWTLLFILRPEFPQVLPTELLITSGVVISLILLLLRANKEEAFTGWAWTMGGIFYIGWLFSFLVAMRALPDGRDWVFLALLATFASDTSAYLVGRSIGRHKMAPYVSPNKSWEGAVAGVVGSIIISSAVVIVFGLPLSYWQTAGLGALISIVGQLGDLVKSLFKRNTGVKDSGNVLPGHGGFLDRMDSVVFASCLVYLYAVSPLLFK